MKFIGIVLGSIFLTILIVASIVIILAAAGFVNLYRIPKDVMTEAEWRAKYEKQERSSGDYATGKPAPNVYEVPFSLPQVHLMPATKPIEIPVNVPEITFKQIPQRVPVEVSIPVFEPKIVTKNVEVPVVVPSIILKGVRTDPPIIKAPNDPSNYRYEN